MQVLLRAPHAQIDGFSRGVVRSAPHLLLVHNVGLGLEGHAGLARERSLQGPVQKERLCIQGDLLGGGRKVRRVGGVGVDLHRAAAPVEEGLLALIVLLLRAVPGGLCCLHDV